MQNTFRLQDEDSHFAMPTMEESLEKKFGTRVPNLIIAGAQKSGTTWLHNALRHHDEFFMSVKKELGFFNRESNFENDEALKDYLSNFHEADQQRYVGESTPHYMWVKPDTKPYDPDIQTFPGSCGSFIKKVLPNAKIIMVLRDPASRAVSGYHHHFALGRVDTSTPIEEVDPRHGVLDIGHYARHITYWSEVFEDNLHVYLYDELKSSPTEFLRKLFDDLAVADRSEPIADELAKLRINSKQNIIARNEERSDSKFPDVTEQQVKSLVDIFEEDIQFMEDFMHTDLAHWRDYRRIAAAIRFS